MTGLPVAIITGAASGIGRHWAAVLMKEGYRLVLGDINEEGLAAAFPPRGTPDNVEIQVLDVTSVDSWVALFQTALNRYNRVDYLFNIAGIITPGYIHETDVEQIDRHLNINTKGTMIGTKLAAELMVEQKQGHIINVASLAGIAPVPGLNLYAASKAAIRSFSLSVANELVDKGVAVTVICPDLVDTPMLEMQLDYAEAALSFSGSARPLTVRDMEKAFREAMQDKPLEITVPPSRGLLAKIASMFPATHHQLRRILTRKGLRQQKKIRQKRRKE